MKGYVKFSIVNTLLEKIIFNFYSINWPIPASVWCCTFLLTLLIKIYFFDTKINLLQRKKTSKMEVYRYCTSPYCWKFFRTFFFYPKMYIHRVTTIDYNFAVSFVYFILWKTFVQCFISLTFKIFLLGNHLFNNRKFIYFLFVNAIR